MLAHEAQHAPRRIQQVQRAVHKCTAATSLRAIVFDMTALKYADASEFRAVAAAAEAVAILGIKPLMVGLNPGIIMHLVQSDVDAGCLQAFLDLSDALRHLGLTAAGSHA